MSSGKPILRDRFHRLRAGLAEDERRRAVAPAVERLLALPEVESAETLLVCMAFADELGTEPLIAALRAAGRVVTAPRAVPGTRRMTVHPLPCALRTLRFGLRQPAAGEPEIDPGELDVAVVAGLAFDLHGVRLGYGSGYFDRFLAGREDLLKIGWCFDVQLVDELPREPHDVPMDLVVTERRVARR